MVFFSIDSAIFYVYIFFTVNRIIAPSLLYVSNLIDLSIITRMYRATCEAEI